MIMKSMSCRACFNAVRFAIALAAIFFFMSCWHKSPMPVAQGTKLPDLRGFNLIIISLDSLRQDRLGTYGYDRSVSPFLDSLSRRSVIFTDVFAQSPATSSSHYSIFTSRYVTNAYKSGLEPQQSFAGLLAANDWRTAAITGGGILSKKYLKDKGFEYIVSQRQSFSQTLEKAREWISTHQHERFFLFLHTYQTHAPFHPKGNPEKLFQEDYQPAHEVDISTLNHTLLNKLPLTDQDFTYLSANYDGNVKLSDSQLAAFYGFLKELSLNTKTVLVIISDHGVSFGERSYVGHCQLYEVQLRVPLIFHVPGLKPTIVDEAVENIDISPTLLQMFHYPIPAYFQGSDLTDTILRRPKRISKEHRRSEYDHIAIRNDAGWKFILREKPEADELYYIPKDPAEENNVIETNLQIASTFRLTLERQAGRPLAELRKPIFKLRSEVMPLFDMSSTRKDTVLRDQLKELGYLE